MLLALGLCSTCDGIVDALLFSPYTPWAGILRKVHIPKSFLMKQSNLNHVRFRDAIHAFC